MQMKFRMEITHLDEVLRKIKQKPFSIDVYLHMCVCIEVVSYPIRDW